jgi:hypothetical protein
MSMIAQIGRLLRQRAGRANLVAAIDDPGVGNDPVVAGAAAPARGGRARRVAAGVTTALAVALVLFGLLAPDRIDEFTPAVFVRIPLEGLLGVALILVLPVPARRWVATGFGAILGVLTIVNVFDIGFFAAFSRPFDPMLDWTFLGPAVDFVGRSAGRALTIVAVIVAALLIIAVPVLMTLSALRLSRLVVRHTVASSRTIAVLGVAWVGCALLGAQLVPGVPVASHTVATSGYDQVRQIGADLKDQRAFAAESAVDTFRGTPGQQLLTSLRGKDVLLVFVESYGRDAVQNPELAPQVSAVLEAGARQLRTAGFDSRSAFLTSPTSGGGSWLAHSTLQSGLWINNQRRYHDLVGADRTTLTSAFHRAGWRTVGVLPANTTDWPEGGFYGYDQILDDRNLGYHGPAFSFASIPDQYTLSAFQRAERGPGHSPVMAEIDLLSSHAPWSPIPPLLDWQRLGDGSVFGTITGGSDSPKVVFERNVHSVRADYRQTIEYSLRALISYLQNYGDKNLVVMFLGDHQPAPIITGDNASRDVPMTIVAQDPAVLAQISGWGWQEGLEPGPRAPVWRMDTFRDRFLVAFSSPAH